ncbi:MAG TPA: divalent metal cation transporter [Woeseiaceae bacterium]|nr:divalent metal cation transporter [Woeseiaceae bacterium]
MPKHPGGMFKAIGPGVLYAATAVGASHLVQSTRAGASYGCALVLLIAVTFVAKYPAFRFSAQYASATGHSLLHGYRYQGTWAVATYIIIAIGTMFAAVPAVTLVTAGLAKVAFGLQMGTFGISVIILAGCTVVLIVGGYHVLDRLVKVLMVLLSVATIVATALVIPNVDWEVSGTIIPTGLVRTDVFFIVALLGLMPSSVDISVWHSLWSVAKARDTEHPPTLNQSLADFHLGYVGAFVLALCFVLLGAGVMHNSGLQFESGATEFAAQLIELYKKTLGEWSGPLIGIVAVAVMFSTVLTGLDGYPRAAVNLLHIFAEEKLPSDASQADKINRKVYAAALILLVLGSVLILYFFVTSQRLVVDIAATIMFLFAPIIAWLNHRAMTSPEIMTAARPGRGLLVLSHLGVFWMAAFSVYYLYLRLSG